MTALALPDLAQEIDAERPVSRSAISLALIKDGGAQMRVDMHPETIADYAADMLDGAVFPPVVVYHDGEVYWLGDGFHRVEAARKIDRQEIEAEIRGGTARDAILHGIGANATHGLRRTQADKRRAVEKLLIDPEWAAWSDRKIAHLAKVDHKTVGKIRRELSGEIPTPKSLSGGIPTLSGLPNKRGSLLADVLRSVPDDVLVAECRRRGLIVEDGGDA
jgi:ParB-like nuclease domain